MITEPWVFSVDRWIRRLEENSDPHGHPLPFRAICLACMLPATMARPTKRAKWMARCDACGARAFLFPASVWGIAGLSADLWCSSPAEVAAIAADRSQFGHALECRVGWGDRTLTVRRRRGDGAGPTWSSRSVPHLRGLHACLYCGEPGSAVVRLNQLDHPQVGCSSCQTIVHSVRPELVATYLGWSAWLQQDAAGGGHAWRNYRAVGRRTWLAWSGGGAVPAQGGEAEHPNSKEVAR